MQRTLLALALLAAGTLVALPTEAAAPSLVKGLQRNLDAVRAQAAALEERVRAPLPPNPGADAAGIADGGLASTLGGLRRAGMALAHGLHRLRESTAPDRVREQEVLVHMGVELRAFVWTLDDIEDAPDPTAPLARARTALGHFERAAENL
ncbi:MAG: hypothetical protein KDG89_17320 [Geminicoccaceae bacterium]|nr:hypothetical protein [Geminicoccaceae bacterium]